MLRGDPADRASVLKRRHRPEDGAAKERCDIPLAERAEAFIEDFGHPSERLLCKEDSGYTEPFHDDMGVVFHRPPFPAFVQRTFDFSGCVGQFAGLTCSVNIYADETRYPLLPHVFLAPLRHPSWRDGEVHGKSASLGL